MTVTASNELAEGIASFLIDQGAPGLQSEEVDEGMRLTAHFAGPVPIDGLKHLCDALLELFPDADRPVIQVRRVTDVAWSESWKAHFPPLTLGNSLFVHPPWVKNLPAQRIGISIDPGMAFGTGHHASTRGCLVLLEDVMRSLSGGRVLDIGTGSGILAVAAAKLGAVDVWAVDIDEDARRVAVENAALNHVDAGLHVCADLDEVSGTFDLVLANLFVSQLIELTAKIVCRLQFGGVVIGSGVLAEEAPDLLGAWTAAGLTEHARHEEQGWVTFAFRRLRMNG